MNPDIEIRRLLDVLPASGRMFTKITSKPQQSKVIDAPFPVPWQKPQRPIYVNFDLWRQLPQGQRDLVMLRTASYLTNVTWFKLNIYQGGALIGLVGMTAELLQGDLVGVLVATGLTTIAVNRVWRENRSVQRDIDADEEAIKVALRRGYTEADAAKQLLNGIESVANLEGRSVLNFTELIRFQHLKSLANLSPVGIPDSVKMYE